MPRPGSVCRRLFAALVLVLVLAPGAAWADRFWVGSGRGCTHANLQAAIDAAQTSASQNDTIHLVGAGPFTGPFSIVGPGITIVGGVDGCGYLAPKRYATLLAPSGQRPLSILLGEPGLITLRSLVLTTRSGTLKGDGGGLWIAGGSNESEVVLDDSRVVSNGSLGRGGGVFVSGGTLYLTRGAAVNANTALYGGGIAAINDASVVVDSSQVASNAAWSHGGGIYQEGGGWVRVGDIGGLGQPAYVAGNVAGEDGGGLYLGPWATARLGEAARASITGNQARRGGGMYLDDAVAWTWQVEIAHNTASETGGGVHLAAGAIGHAGDPLAGGYPYFAGNRAGEGAALYAGELTQVNLWTGTFRGHETDGPLVAATGATVNGAGLAISGNRASELFALAGGSDLTLQYVSVAANDLAQLVRWDGTGPGILIENSAFAETEPFFSSVAAPQVSPQLNCIVSLSVAPFLGMPSGTGMSDLVLADPMFVAPEMGDLHAAPGSPVIDRCLGVGIRYDIDGDRRTFDDPSRPNPPDRVSDAGADEVVSF